MPTAATALVQSNLTIRQLVRLALANRPNNTAVPIQITDWIIRQYPYYGHNRNSLQHLVRNALSEHGEFVRVGRSTHGFCLDELQFGKESS